MSYRTIILPFTVYNKDAILLQTTAKLWKACFEKVFEEVKQRPWLISHSLNYFKNTMYKIAYEIIPYKYYAESCCELAYEIGRSIVGLRFWFFKKLGMWYPLDLTCVEIGNWLMFESRGDKYAKGNPGIKLLSLNQVEVKVFDNNGKESWVKVRVGSPKSRRFRYMLEEVIQLAQNKEIAYNARVYLRAWIKTVIKGEVQIAIPYEIYIKYYRDNIDLNDTSLKEYEFSFGIDVNFDRINFCLIDFKYNIVDMYTFWINNLMTQGFPAKDRRTRIIQELYKILNWFKMKYGNYIVSIEDPEVLGVLKMRWIIFGLRGATRYNYKVAIFEKSILEDIYEICCKLSIQVIKVDPKGTTHSDEHEQIMQKFGLDRHMASAYIIAKRGLQQYKEKKTKTIKK